jgi:hypothetical protein
MRIKKNTRQVGNQGIYKTKDIYIASFLKARNVPLVSFEKDGSAIVFVFTDQGNVGELVGDYFRGGIVEAQRFKGALKELKSAIYDYKDNLTRGRERRNQNG